MIYTAVFFLGGGAIIKVFERVRENQGEGYDIHIKQLFFGGGRGAIIKVWKMQEKTKGS